MTIRTLLGRVMMTLAALVTGILPLRMDLNPSHIYNPEWPPHARFHGVWLIASGALIGLVVLYQIWQRRREGASLAALLVALVLGGFFIACFTVDAYGGSLSDGLGLPLSPPERATGLPGNVISFSIASLLLIVGYLLARTGERRT